MSPQQVSSLGSIVTQIASNNEQLVIFQKEKQVFAKSELHQPINNQNYGFTCNFN